MQSSEGTKLASIAGQVSTVVELVDVSGSDLHLEAVPPLQLIKFEGDQSDPASTLWFAAGLDGNSRTDSYILNLFNKALSKGVFKVAADTYITPLVNPYGLKNHSRFNRESIDLLKNFPLASQPQPEKLAIETRTLMRWARMLQPRALVTMSVGEPMIRCENIPAAVAERLAEISEKKLWGADDMSLVTDVPGGLVAQGETVEQSSYMSAYAQFMEEVANLTESTETSKPDENWESSLGLWCVEQGIGWIHFGIGESARSFEELAAEEWRTCIGPALKWLCEGLRFNPPKEEQPVVPKLEVIPAIEIPADFANW